MMTFFHKSRDRDGAWAKKGRAERSVAWQRRSEQGYNGSAGKTFHSQSRVFILGGKRRGPEQNYNSFVGETLH